MNAQVRSWTTLVPLAAAIVLGLAWGRALPTPIVGLVTVLLVGAVLAAVHHVAAADDAGWWQPRIPEVGGDESQAIVRIRPGWVHLQPRAVMLHVIGAAKTRPLREQ